MLSYQLLDRQCSRFSLLPPDQWTPFMATVSPIKVNAATNRLISDAAHFLGRTKKDIVDAAVRDNVEAHRNEMNEAIRASLARLDGSKAAVVAEITGISRGELDDLGGVPER